MRWLWFCLNKRNKALFKQVKRSLALAVVLFEQIKRSLALGLVLFKQVKRGLAQALVLFKQTKQGLALALVLFKHIKGSLDLALVLISEWSPIRSVIVRVITESDDRAAGVRFVYHEYDYRPNWTTRSPIAN